MEKDGVLVIDQSTSGTKALILDRQGEIIARADKGHEQKISSQGWVSHDPEEIYRNTIAVVRMAAGMPGVDAAKICCAAISNQRETALVWDRLSGSPLADAVVWQCARGEAICDALGSQASEIRRKTGLRLSPYFSAAKIAWILQHTQNKGAGNLCAGTIDSWLIYKLTGQFKTDFSNASRTQLFNISSLAWDKDICTSFGIPINFLPEVCDSSSDFGSSDFGGILPKKVPIRGVMGDSHAALFGQGCLEKGMGKATYGTGSSVMVNIGEKPLFCENIVTSLAWGMNGTVNYVLEGNINYTGAVIKWLMDDVKLIASSKEAGALAASANPADSCYMVPAFSGLGAPYWKSEAKAVLCGMTRTTGKAEIVRAAEDSIAYQITDVIRSMYEESGIPLKELRVDGGPTRDKYLMQFQSDILNIPLSIPEYEELSAIGAGYMAGITIGLYSPEILNEVCRKRYDPQMDAAAREKRYQGWREAVRHAIA
ncbi:glycerol kinase 1 [Spirochaetia bacterium]|nr:glycerol kinase 1 [Spirochaetia bacterium]